MTHAQPAIRLNNTFAYINGSLPIPYQTGTNALDVLLNTQRYYSTATTNNTPTSDQNIITLWAGNDGRYGVGTQVTFSTPFGSPPTFTDGTNTATLVSAVFAGFANEVLSCQFATAAGSPKTIANLTTGTAIIFQNPPLYTWGSGTPTTFDYYAKQDSNTSLYTPSFVSSATIAIHRNGQDINTSTITGLYTYSAHGFNIYQFGFIPQFTTQIQPADQVFVTMYPSQFYNYITLSLFINDTLTYQRTNVNYTVEYLT
jgi:hypothetical protein